MKINADQLIAILGKEKADSLFLNPEWIKKQRPYMTMDIRYIVWEQFGRLKDLGNDDYEGNLYLQDIGPQVLQYLPKIKKLDGIFGCAGNMMISLEGCPEIVLGEFACFDNKLSSLKGSPKYVGHDFDCENNQLVDLKGSPKFVGGEFRCGDNQLTSLDGISEEIRGEFSIGMHTLPGDIERTTNGKTYRLV